eukprot:m.9746 g.9746  ORF g.9746 m.9746 type:complete len:310 (-) comp5488_c0_seq1:3253-4182(-)
MSVIVECLGGGQGFPSLDADVNSIVAYAALAQARDLVKLEPQQAPLIPRTEFSRDVFDPSTPFAYASKTGEMATFGGNRNGMTLLQMVDVLAAQGCNLEYGVANRNQAEIMAVVEMVQQCLRPAIEYQLYANSTNYSAVTSSILTKPLHPVFKYLVYQPFSKRAEKLARGRSEQELNADVVLCLGALDDMIQDPSLFLFGSRPTLADAVVVAHVTLMLRLALPSSPFPTITAAMPKLNQWVERIANDVFKKEALAYKSELSQKQRDASKSFYSKYKQQIETTGFVVLAAGLIYSFSVSSRLLPPIAVLL